MSERRRLSIITVLAMVTIMTVLVLFVRARTMGPLSCGGTVDTSVYGSGNFASENDTYSTFTRESTSQGVYDNSIRSLKMIQTGLFIGYSGQLDANLSFYSGDHFERCAQRGDVRITGHINAIAQNWGANDNGDIIVVTDGNGVFRFHEDAWTHYTTEDGLTDNRGYDVDFNTQGDLLVSTWEGVSYFNAPRQEWYELPGLLQPGVSTHIDAVEAVGSTEHWYATIHDGVVRVRQDGSSVFRAESVPRPFVSNEIRVMKYHPATTTMWVGSESGGLSGFNLETGTWSIEYLPVSYGMSTVYDLDWDHYQRLWVTTDFGVLYLEDGTWIEYAPVPSLSLEFGCDECAFSQDQVFIGTDGSGLLLGKVPEPVTGS